MQYKCDFCNDTGSLDQDEYLNCGHCAAADDRVALNTFVRSLGVNLTLDERTWAIHQRALAMAPKQEADHINDVINMVAPAGWKLVSIELTDAMAVAAIKVTLGNPAVNGVDQYRAMLGAAPAAPAAANGAPELPRAEVRTDMHIDGKGQSAYNADQMRAYGQACAATGPDAALVELIHKAQSILAKHLPPDGPDAKTTISALLGLLDGPESRAALSGAKGN